MYKRLFEIICGMIILLIIVIFVVYAAKIVFKYHNNTYVVKAEFNEIGGLTEGSSVIIKGVKIGEVYKIVINKENNIIVYLKVNSEINLPIDSKIIIKDLDLFSGRRVEIIPGNSNKIAKNGTFMTNTVDYLYLEDKINKIIFSTGK
ncbi:MlaD family protein [Rickettsiales bacterium LUAb2]